MVAKSAPAGTVVSIIIAHSVLTAPFAMAIIRLRLSQMDASLESAAWNPGADQWRALRRVIVPFLPTSDYFIILPDPRYHSMNLQLPGSYLG